MNTRKWDTFQHSLIMLGHLIYAAYKKFLLKVVCSLLLLP